MNTLHLLGDPEYIHLLVNPEERTVMVMPAESHEYLSHHVRAFTKTGKRECEICSMDLLRRLKGITGNSGNATTVYEGRYVSERNAAVFSVGRDQEPTGDGK